MKGMKGMVAFCILTVILVGWVGVYAVEANPGCPMKGFGKHGGMFQEVLTKLQLSDSQKQDVANVLKQHREEMQGLRSQMFDARQALFQAVTADPANEHAVREAAAKAADLEVQLAVNRAKVFGEIRKLLTAEQQTTLQKLTSEFASRRHMGMGHKSGMMDRWIEENSNL
jgi:Spy/CpxP family protein refolding chaperone